MKVALTIRDGLTNPVHTQPLTHTRTTQPQWHLNAGVLLNLGVDPNCFYFNKP